MLRMIAKTKILPNNDSNNHTNNDDTNDDNHDESATLVSAFRMRGYTFHHDSTYIILFLIWHNDPMRTDNLDNKNINRTITGYCPLSNKVTPADCWRQVESLLNNLIALKAEKEDQIKWNKNRHENDLTPALRARVTGRHNKIRQWGMTSKRKRPKWHLSINLTLTQ